MSTTTYQVLPDNSTTAHFRAWGLAHNTALAAVGQVQTADTGQINWTTVAAPGAGNTSQGYEIWKFADTLQATTPIFYKIEYGSGAATADPSLWFTIGTSSDGAGNITGTTMYARTQVALTSSDTTNMFDTYVSGTSGRIAVALWVGRSGTVPGTQFPLQWGIERSKDNNGNDTATAFMLGISANTPGNQWQWMKPTAPQPGIETSFIVAMPTVNTSMTDGTTTGFAIPVPFSPSPQNPGYNWMLFRLQPGDFTNYTIAGLTVYGTNHSYLAVPAHGVLATGSAAALLMRYE